MATAKKAVKKVSEYEEAKVEFAKNATNLHKVPVTQWKRWSVHARYVFNSVYIGMADQELFKHPLGASQTKDCWKTTCWNAAWHAASACDQFKG